MKETVDVNWGMHLLELEITYRCNLNCLHCYNRDESLEDMGISMVKELIKTANHYGVQKLVITGGEAALHPDFCDLCDFIITNRLSFSNIQYFVLQSNGFIKNVDEKYLQAFDIIHLSYDIADSNTRSIDFQHQIELAKRLQNQGIYTYFFATISRENKDSIDYLTTVANNNGIPLAFNLCTLVGNRNESLMLSNSEVRLVLKKLLQLEKAGKIRPLKHPYTAILRGKTSSQYIGNRAGCTAGIASMVVKANGDVMPCPFLRVVCGSVFKDGLYKTWMCSPEFAVLRNRSSFKQCGSCKYISYCGGCRKNSYEATGYLDGADPICPSLFNQDLKT